MLSWQSAYRNVYRSYYISRCQRRKVTMTCPPWGMMVLFRRIVRELAKEDLPIKWFFYAQQPSSVLCQGAAHLFICACVRLSVCPKATFQNRHPESAANSVCILELAGYKSERMPVFTYLVMSVMGQQEACRGMKCKAPLGCMRYIKCPSFHFISHKYHFLGVIQRMKYFNMDHVGWN